MYTKLTYRNNTDAGEIHNVIRKESVKNAPGHDIINNIIVKNLPKKKYFFHIYWIHYLDCHIFKKDWKLSNFFDSRVIVLHSC